jgi:hypothetical protein
VNTATLRALVERRVFAPLLRLRRDVDWGRFAKRALVVGGSACAFLAFSLFMVHSYVFPFDGLKHWGGDYSDCGQFTWNLWFVAESLLDFENPLWTDTVEFPVGANLAVHTLVSGFAPLTLLVKLFSGSHPLYPIIAYNLAIWVSFTLSLALGYLALREAGFCRWASIIPATGYAFSCFFYWHWLHINLLAGFLFPLLAYLLIRLHKTPTLKRGLLSGFFTGYGVYLTEFSLSAVIAMALLCAIAMAIGPSRRGVLRVLRELGPKGIALTVATAAIVAAPFLWTFLQADALPPKQSDFQSLCANLMSYVVPDPKDTPLYGDLLEDLQVRIQAGRTGAEVFLGFPFILCMLIGLVRPGSAYTLLITFVGLCFVLLSFGTTLMVFESPTEIKMPYHWLRDLPFFEHNRAPARFSAVAHFCFVFPAAAGLQFIVTRLGRLGPFARDAAIVICTGLFVWTVMETRQTIELKNEPYEAPPAQVWSKLVSGPVVQLPKTRWPCSQALFQTFHGRPMMNSCLARGSRSRAELLREYNGAFTRGGGVFSRFLKHRGVTNVLVTDDLLAHEIKVLNQLEGINVVELDPQPRRVVAVWGDTKSPTGRNWHRAKKWTIRENGTKVFERPGLTATRIDVLINWNNRYRVELMRGRRPIVTLWAKALNWSRGGQWRFIDVPPAFHDEEFDTIRITPGRCTGRHRLAAVAVLK